MSYSLVRITKHNPQQNCKCLTNKDLLLTDKMRLRYCSIHAKHKKIRSKIKKKKEQKFTEI